MLIFDVCISWTIGRHHVAPCVVGSRGNDADALHRSIRMSRRRRFVSHLNGSGRYQNSVFSEHHS
jgi:hypothetical protein